MIGTSVFIDEDILKGVSLKQEALPYQGIAFCVSHKRYGDIGRILIFREFICDNGDATFCCKISGSTNDPLAEIKREILKQIEPIIALQLKPIFVLALSGEKQQEIRL